VFVRGMPDKLPTLETLDDLESIEVDVAQITRLSEEQMCAIGAFTVGFALLEDAVRSGLMAILNMGRTDFARAFKSKTFGVSLRELKASVARTVKRHGGLESEGPVITLKQLFREAEEVGNFKNNLFQCRVRVDYERRTVFLANESGGAINATPKLLAEMRAQAGNCGVEITMKMNLLMDLIAKRQRTQPAV
jgi:hypothetical protein